VLVMLVRRRSPPTPTPTTGIDRLRLPLPYVANVCFRCFNRFKGMLQLILMDVAKVDRECSVAHIASVSEACCKRLFKIFYLFQTYVASVLIRMFAYVETCSIRSFYFIRLLQVFYLDVVYVTMTML
jgi:hypothetical protein